MIFLDTFKSDELYHNYGFQRGIFAVFIVVLSILKLKITHLFVKIETCQFESFTH